MTEIDRDQDQGSILNAAPGLARIAVFAGWRTAEWAVGTTARAYSRAFSAAVRGEPPSELFSSAGEEMREYTRRMLGLLESEERRQRKGPSSRGGAGEREAGERLLRERGAELLENSADVRFNEEAHPAYLGILEQLAPDEGRILRLIATKGPQPSVDVRNGWPIVSNLVAPGRNMIGAEAGCRYMDRVPAYLNNLNRLGLVWFSRERIDDPLVYQVLEAQPDVIAAMHKAGRTARTVRRSILLTPFGVDFCQTCLPMETYELDALPDPAPDEVPAPGEDPEPVSEPIAEAPAEEAPAEVPAEEAPA
jgi:abortive infection alpha-like protein